MSKALVVGGSSGIGQAIALQLLKEGKEHVYIVARKAPRYADIPSAYRKIFQENTTFYSLDLNTEKYDIFDGLQDIDTLIYTAGFGRVAFFESLTEIEIKNLIKCNELAAIQVLKKYYHKIKSKEDFYCSVLVSISGHLASPLFSVYGAAKAGLAMLIQNINLELSASGYTNRILDCSPGAIKGTLFNGKNNDINNLLPLAEKIVLKMLAHNTVYIPQYNNLYKDILDWYKRTPYEYGKHSYQYKIDNGRISDEPQVLVGYLSGTFDLFHIGHLNLLRRAKAECDYLVVGVHESGAWKGKETFIPFEERKAIVENIKYVDKVIMSYKEDSDAWAKINYNKLFVGSDYKGSERFARYEEFFKDKGVEIVYFPYTQGTSSTQLRNALKAMKK